MERTYQGILNCVHGESHKQYFQSMVNCVSSNDHIVVAPSVILQAIKHLKKGKSVGHDLLAAEHFMHMTRLFF